MMPIAKFHKQRRVRRGVYKARFTKQRQNWRGTTKAAATPTLASISPTNVDEDAAATTVTLTGTGFVSGVTRAMINEGDVTTTFVSATSLTIVIPASMLVEPGTLSISVHSGLLVAPTPRTFTINDVVEPLLADPTVSPSAYVIAEIQGWVDAHPDLADEVLAAEQASTSPRVTLIDWLQGFISHRDEGTTP